MCEALTGGRLQRGPSEKGKMHNVLALIIKLSELICQDDIKILLPIK